MKHYTFKKLTGPGVLTHIALVAKSLEDAKLTLYSNISIEEYYGCTWDIIEREIDKNNEIKTAS